MPLKHPCQEALCQQHRAVLSPTAAGCLARASGAKDWQSETEVLSERERDQRGRVVKREKQRDRDRRGSETGR